MEQKTGQDQQPQQQKSSSSSSLDDLLAYDSLAFTTKRKASDDDNDNNNDELLVTAVARAPFVFHDTTTTTSSVINSSCIRIGASSNTGIELNVELFGGDATSWTNRKNDNDSESDGGIVCYVHGVCESAETWTVQNLARVVCQQQPTKWRLAVLELEGHGLSSSALSSSDSSSNNSSNTNNSRGVLQVGKMDRYVQQVVQFCHHIIHIDQILQKQKHQHDKATETKLVLCGSSLGGVLVAYATQQMMMHRKTDEERHTCNLVGSLLLSPAVGVDPKVIPSWFIVAALSLLAWILPSEGIMTPLEDPSHYNCPSTTSRNFSGHWPLATSKLLLDITSRIVPSDIQSGTLNLVKALATIAEKRTSPTPIITVVSGDKDPVVPIEAVRYFVSTMNDTTGTTSAATTTIKSYIDLIEIANGDHGLLAQSVNDTPQLNTNNKTKKRSTTQETLDHVSSFLERCVRIL